MVMMPALIVIICISRLMNVMIMIRGDPEKPASPRAIAANTPTDSRGIPDTTREWASKFNNIDNSGHQKNDNQYQYISQKKPAESQRRVRQSNVE